MSSIYFDNDLALNDYANVTCIAWSKGEEQPLLAVADGCTLRIFREGEELLDYNQERQGLPCTALAWHPTSKVIAAGWEDGAVTFTGPGAVNARDDREVHRDARILSIVFNPNGTRCVTTDNNGVVGVWKTDQRGLCNQMCHYRKSGAHDKVIFRTATPTGEPNLENPPFFFGGEQGIIYLADDFGLCSERYKIGSPLLLLEYYREKDVVVLVTKSVILVQFSLSADGKVTNESKLKLSCGPTPEKLQGCWAGPGLLATCSHESILRIWNLADDENYILSLQGIDERNSLSGDKVTSVDYNPRKQVLACGTRGGRMVQWRSSTLSGVPKSESNWQVLPVVSVGECAVDKLTWGPGEGLIHARTERSSVILSEAQLNTAVQAPLMAVQSSPMEIIVYHTERQVHLTVTANYRVKGLGVGPSTVLLGRRSFISQSALAEVLTAVRESGELRQAALVYCEALPYIGCSIP
ncbi:unnamed protein product [Cladocopium goreaui]|uniref:Intraflagellar transport protein 140 homolog (WD and tetratricopeptide repeats protein 2) n=1 Tax=Cladocopium goreaui TaxID=2562237 RepID=A0A9P1GLX9_9DINO|nr:unnamed protein product [Cladocopium goreaui]